MSFLKIYLPTLVFMILVDFLWIGVVAKGFYATHLAEIGNYEDGRLKVVYWAAVTVYLILAAGICVYVLPLAGGSLGTAALYGAGFGFVTYGIYDFTNYATLKGYPLILLAGDLAWGTCVCAMGAAAACFFQGKFA